MKGSLQTIIGKLEDLFQTFNDEYYEGKLEKPVIAVFPDTTQGAYGWCTCWKAWKTDAPEGEEVEGYYEINICAEHLTRPFMNVCGTLLHEMVHLWNLQNDVKDTSRGGTYHNKKFKEVAEQHGLIIDKDIKYGWTITHLSPETEHFIQEMGDIKFEMKRDRTLKVPPNSKGSSGSSGKSSSRKYVCPSCGMSVRATKVVNVMCGDCEEIMEVEE